MTLSALPPIRDGKAAVLWHACDTARGRWLVKAPRKAGIDLAAREYLGGQVARALGVNVPALVAARLGAADLAKIGGEHRLLVARGWLDLPPLIPEAEVEDDHSFRRAESWEALMEHDRAALLVYASTTGGDFDIVRFSYPRDVHLDRSGRAWLVDLESVSAGGPICSGTLTTGPTYDHTRPVLRRVGSAALAPALADLDALAGDAHTLGDWATTLSETFGAAIDAAALGAWLSRGATRVREILTAPF